MITASHSSYTTSDLRRAEVVDEAFVRPISVRDGKTGRMLLMVPQETINQSNAVSRYTQLFTRLVVECQRPDPSPVGLDEASFVIDLQPDQRQFFLREFAEALSASVAEDNPEAIEAYLTYMAGSTRQVPAQFTSSFLESQRAAIEVHLAKQ
jgi:hypothetical protein